MRTSPWRMPVPGKKPNAMRKPCGTIHSPTTTRNSASLNGASVR